MLCFLPQCRDHLLNMAVNHFFYLCTLFFFMGGSGTNICLDCEQHFCINCKSLHKRQKGTKNHVFQSAEDVVQEVKLRCKEHKEDFYRKNRCYFLSKTTQHNRVSNYIYNCVSCILIYK
jgi:hypothetical protein